MPSNPIDVTKRLFLGRVEEQKQFRAVLNEVLAAPPEEDLPYVVFLYGDGGMGKTMLARRFRDIAQMDQPFAGEFQILWIDWKEERRRWAALQVGREHVSPETVFDILYANALNAKWGSCFGAYQGAVKKRREAEKKAAEVLSSSGEGRPAGGGGGRAGRQSISQRRDHGQHGAGGPTALCTGSLFAGPPGCRTV